MGGSFSAVFQYPVFFKSHMHTVHLIAEASRSAVEVHIQYGIGQRLSYVSHSLGGIS